MSCSKILMSAALAVTGANGDDALEHKKLLLAERQAAYEKAVRRMGEKPGDDDLVLEAHQALIEIQESITNHKMSALEMIIKQSSLPVVSEKLKENAEPLESESHLADNIINDLHREHHDDKSLHEPEDPKSKGLNDEPLRSTLESLKERFPEADRFREDLMESYVRTVIHEVNTGGNVELPATVHELEDKLEKHNNAWKKAIKTIKRAMEAKEKEEEDNWKKNKDAIGKKNKDAIGKLPFQIVKGILKDLAAKLESPIQGRRDLGQINVHLTNAYNFQMENAYKEEAAAFELLWRRRED